MCRLKSLLLIVDISWAGIPDLIIYNLLGTFENNLKLVTYLWRIGRRLEARPLPSQNIYFSVYRRSSQQYKLYFVISSWWWAAIPTLTGQLWGVFGWSRIYLWKFLDFAYLIVKIFGVGNVLLSLSDTSEQISHHQVFCPWSKPGFLDICPLTHWTQFIAR